MTSKKNKFFTLIFSTMFGAGHMYMGFMKQGISIMTAAAAVIAVGTWTGIGTVYFVLPVLWFYSFFDSINKMTMPDRVFQTLEDHYILLPSNDNVQLKYLITKYEKVIAIILILIGSSVLSDNILRFIAQQASIADYTDLADFVDSLRWNGSRIIFSVVIIVIGIKMIIGKKKELDMEETDIIKQELDFAETGIKKQESDFDETGIKKQELVFAETGIKKQESDFDETGMIKYESDNKETAVKKNELMEDGAVHASPDSNTQLMEDKEIMVKEETDENA